VNIVDVIEAEKAIQQNENSRPILPSPKEPQYDVTSHNGKSENRDEEEYSKPRLMRIWFP
jgi:hypothetical protein